MTDAKPPDTELEVEARQYEEAYIDELEHFVKVNHHRYDFYFHEEPMNIFKYVGGQLEQGLDKVLPELSKEAKRLVDLTNLKRGKELIELQSKILFTLKDTDRSREHKLVEIEEYRSEYNNTLQLLKDNERFAYLLIELTKMYDDLILPEISKLLE